MVYSPFVSEFDRQPPHRDLVEQLLLKRELMRDAIAEWHNAGEGSKEYIIKSWTWDLDDYEIEVEASWQTEPNHGQYDPDHNYIHITARHHKLWSDEEDPEIHHYSVSSPFVIWMNIDNPSSAQQIEINDLEQSLQILKQLYDIGVSEGSISDETLASSAKLLTYALYEHLLRKNDKVSSNTTLSRLMAWIKQNKDYPTNSDHRLVHAVLSNLMLHGVTTKILDLKYYLGANGEELNTDQSTVFEEDESYESTSLFWQQSYGSTKSCIEINFTGDEGHICGILFDQEIDIDIVDILGLNEEQISHKELMVYDILLDRIYELLNQRRRHS